MVLFRVFTNGGLDTLLTRSIARKERPAVDILSEMSGALLPLAVLTFICMHTIAAALGFSEAERWVLLAFSAYLIFDSWGRYVCAIFRGFEKMQFEMIVLVFERFLMFLVILLSWQKNYPLLQMVWGLAAVQVLKWLLAVGLAGFFFVPWRLRFDKQKIIPLLRIAFPFALVIAFDTVTTRVDIVMLKMMHGDVVAGNYNAARRLLESAAFIPENIYNSLLPAVSLLFVNDLRNYQQTFRRAFIYMIVIALPLTIILVLLSPWLIDLVLPQEFTSADIAFRYLAVVLGFLFIKFFLAAAFNSAGQQHRLSILMFCGMLMNVFLNALLIPLWAIEGAGLATILSECLMTGIGIVWLSRLIDSSLIGRDFWLVILAATLVLPVYLWEGASLPVRSVIFCLIYTCLLNMFGILSLQDLWAQLYRAVSGGR